MAQSMLQQSYFIYSAYCENMKIKSKDSKRTVPYITLESNP